MLAGHTSSCVTAEMQPTGRYLATGGTDSIIALWDTTDWICQRTITRMVGPVRSISELHPETFTLDDTVAGDGEAQNGGLTVQVSHSTVATSWAAATKVYPTPHPLDRSTQILERRCR